MFARFWVWIRAVRRSSFCCCVVFFFVWVRRFCIGGLFFCSFLSLPRWEEVFVVDGLINVVADCCLLDGV